jgi:predicted DNA-binding protein (MmcQ/YjbR family)
MPRPNAHKTADDALKKAALAYPGATLDYPWGHRGFKIKGKLFLITSHEGGVFYVTVKLPVTGKIALTLPFASPTGYGLGKSGWITAQFKKGETVPTDMLIGWLDESFRAIAPKRVVAALDEHGPAQGRLQRQDRQEVKTKSLNHRGTEDTEKTGEGVLDPG